MRVPFEACSMKKQTHTKGISHPILAESCKIHSKLIYYLAFLFKINITDLHVK